ncbi:MAG: hypothetical protein QM756_11035 [Polyangiaceae bacterium]
MNVFDLENPLRVDNCELCGAVHWRDCVCDPNQSRRGAALSRKIIQSGKLVEAEE